MSSTTPLSLGTVQTLQLDPSQWRMSGVPLGAAATHTSSPAVPLLGRIFVLGAEPGGPAPPHAPPEWESSGPPQEKTTPRGPDPHPPAPVLEIRPPT